MKYFKAVKKEQSILPDTTRKSSLRNIHLVTKARHNRVQTDFICSLSQQLPAQGQTQGWQGHPSTKPQSYSYTSSLEQFRGTH